jgi:hypothetical protein
MDNRFQSGQHPDADQLSAFMEKALPEHERLETLAHLAECETCRSIVFLAQKDLLPDAPAAREQELRPWWKNWLLPRPALGVAFASLFLIVASVGIYQVFTNRTQPANEANKPSSAPPPSPSTQATIKPPTLEASKNPAKEPIRQRALPVAPKPSAPMAPTHPAPEPAGNVANGVGHGVNGFAGGVLGGIGAGPAKTPGTASEPPAPSAEAAFASRKQYAAPAQIVTATSAPEGPLHLIIEHGRGADNGLTELHGTVRDPVGAAIPKATISLHGLSGQANASTSSDTAGGFTIPSLPAGQYEIQVASIGFQPLKQQIILQPKDLAQINPILPVGSAAQTVSVAASQPALQTESARISSPIRKSPEARFISQKELRGTLLALDAKGTLFRKEEGDESWKKVRPKWHGSVVQLSTVESIPSDRETAASAAPASGDLPSFLIATSSGETWVSPDGRHWKRR